MSKAPTTTTLDPIDLEQRFFTNMETVQGVLALAGFADYCDRRHGQEVTLQLTDEAISKACFGARQAAEDAHQCFHELLDAYGEIREKVKEGEQ